jgi:hypothetical protein
MTSTHIFITENGDTNQLNIDNMMQVVLGHKGANEVIHNWVKNKKLVKKIDVLA